MRTHTLYAYAEGNEFATIVDDLTRGFTAIVDDRDWVSGSAIVVNQRRGGEDWDLGINLELPNPHEEPDGWFEDIEEIAVRCNEFCERFSISIVLGIADTSSGISSDLFYFDGTSIDIERLKSVIGVSPEE